MYRLIKNCICTMLAVATVGCATKIQNIGQADDRLQLEGPGPYTYDCIAKGGQFYQVHLPIKGDHLRVTGTIHVLTMHPDPKWGSVATVSFSDPTLMKDAVSLQVGVQAFQPDRIRILLRGDGGPNNMAVLTSRPNAETDVPFTLELERGIVSVSVAENVNKSKVPQSDLSRVALSCSGAHVVFKNVVATNGN